MASLFSSWVQDTLPTPVILDHLRSNPLISIGSLFILVITSILTWTVVYRLYFHPLANFPGPKLWAATDIFYAKRYLAGHLYHDLIELHKKYGPIVRTASNNLSIIEGSAWKSIHGNAATKRFQKAHYAKFRQDANSLQNANDEEHARQRRSVNHAFSERALREQESIVMGYVDILIDKLKTKTQAAEDGEVVDMDQWYEYTTFDIIGDLSFSEPFGCLRESSYDPWVEKLTNVMKASSYITIATAFSPLDKILRSLTPKKSRQDMIEFFKVASRKVQRRIATKTDRDDFWSYVLKHDERGMTFAEMEVNSMLMIIAGSETTATALSGTTYALCKTPTAMTLLKEEIRSTFQKEEDINMVALGQLKYLHAVIFEGMRLYPPVPGGLARWVPSEGEIIAGAYVPGGTVVAITQLAAYYNPTNFLNPTEFAPSRWLNDPKYASDSLDVVQPFSVGPRNCIGQNLAWAEMKVILARMIWNFDMELTDDEFDPLSQKALFLWLKHALNIKLIVRTV